MSVVYRARHLLMNRICAVKILHLHSATSALSIKRFKQESELASRLDHPNIVAVHDFDFSSNTTPYLVMDYVEGSSLAELIARLGQLPLDRALRIFIQACDALEHAHEKGIIHRDIKPSNIMLVGEEGDRELVKIVDFGIAKLVQEGEVQGLTRTGETFGSPLYMSPEQCMDGPLGPEADVYSLGCVIYETIVGHPPLVGGNIYETIYKQINETPPGIGDAVEDRRLREDVERILFRAMAKDPEQRYGRMSDMRQDLINVAGGRNEGWLLGTLNSLQLLYMKLEGRRKALRARLLAGFVALLLSATVFLAWSLHQRRQEVLAAAGGRLGCADTPPSG